MKDSPFAWRVIRAFVGALIGGVLGSGTGVVGGMVGAAAGGTLFMFVGLVIGFLLKVDRSPMPWTERSGL